ASRRRDGVADRVRARCPPDPARPRAPQRRVRRRDGVPADDAVLSLRRVLLPGGGVVADPLGPRSGAVVPGRGGAAIALHPCVLVTGCATGGAGAARHLSVGGTMQVAIIGAGLAGLRAAALLEEHGATVEVFEASDRLGGRLCTARPRPGIAYEAGGEWIDHDHLR